MGFKYLILPFIAMVFFTGCAQKVAIRALEPAEVNRAAATKKIAVTSFQNDKVGLSGKIEAAISSSKLDGKDYFTIMSRTDLDKVLAEQRIQNSGILDQGSAVKVGKLLGAQAIISGSVGKPTRSDVSYNATRVKCNKDTCWTYNVPCTKRTVGLSAEIRMIDVQRGDIIYADQMVKSAEWAHCKDDSKAMPSTEMGAQFLATGMSKTFAHKLTPHYRTFKVTLLDDPDLEYSDKQENLLENALLYIKQTRYDKAEALLSRLIESTGRESYVPMYNMGVIKEAQGDYVNAKNFYGAADNLTVEPVDEISAAVIRIDRLIEKRKVALQQIQQGR